MTEEKEPTRKEGKEPCGEPCRPRTGETFGPKRKVCNAQSHGPYLLNEHLTIPVSLVILAILH